LLASRWKRQLGAQDIKPFVTNSATAPVIVSQAAVRA